MTKSDYVKKIMSLAGDTSAATKAKLNALGVGHLKDLLAASQQAAKSVPAKRASTKKQAPKKQAARKPVKRGSVQSISKAARARAASITRAIASGKIAAKQGKKGVGDMAGATARARYTAFLKLYSGAKAKGRKSAAKTAGVKQRYATISGSKVPYYLSAGYTVKSFTVGGGAKGPGIVRAIPKSGAKPFSSVGEATQKKIASFLNAGGKTLRSKGAPSVVNLSEIKRLAAAKSSPKKRSSKKTGTTNRWW